MRSPSALADGLNDVEYIIMNSKWKSKNRHRYLLQYHLIFVCKYRKKLLSNRISDDIKQLSYDICNKHNVVIKHMEIILKLFIQTFLERENFLG